MFRGTEKYIVNGDEKKVTAGKMLIVNDKSHVINKAESSESFSVFLTQVIWVKSKLFAKHPYH